MNHITIGFDDIDSDWGGCTTHLTGIFLYHLKSKVKLLDYPLLVRLNPNIPWKTRGNAATAIHVLYDGDPHDIYDLALWLINEYTGDRGPFTGKMPGLIVYNGDPRINPRFKWLYRKTLTSVVTIDVVEKILGKSPVLYHGGRGIIGAAAASGALGPGEDYTFELIAYRKPEMIGSERCLLEKRALRVEARLHPCTFNNVDWLSGRLSAAPRGPDPVLAGFRGDCPDSLWVYREVLCERPSFWVLYRSNQHTDPHNIPLTGGLTMYSGGLLNMRITGNPSTVSGGHVVVRGVTSWSEPVDIMFYRETEPLQRIALLLAPGDEVGLLGGVKPYTPRGVRTFAVEKLWVYRVAVTRKTVSPRCPICGSRMKSSGRGKGYKCVKCGYHDVNAKPITIRITRRIAPGIYTPREGRLGHMVMPRWRIATRRIPIVPEFNHVFRIG